MTSDNFVRLKVNITHRADGPYALLVTPLGISLSSGLSLRVDEGNAETVPFATCTLGGCFAALPLQGTRGSSWRAGNRLQVRYRDGSNTEVPSEISLIGVTAGLDRLSN